MNCGSALEALIKVVLYSTSPLAAMSSRKAFSASIGAAAHLPRLSLMGPPGAQALSAAVVVDLVRHFSGPVVVV